MRAIEENPLEIKKAEFIEIGHTLVNEIAEFIEHIEDIPITSGKSPKQLEEILGNQPLPQYGLPAKEVLFRGLNLLKHHSLFNGHPKFMGYITSSAAPISAFADFIASALNLNVGAQILSPIATEIEKQTIAWLLEFTGLPKDYGGILVSGGNMANLTCFFAALHAKLPETYHSRGLAAVKKKVVVYCCKTTHTWIEKAAKLSGLGLESVRFVPPNRKNKMDCNLLEAVIHEDKAKGYLPVMVIGTAGDVSTGAVDDIAAISEVCSANNLWFHLDGAYGLPAVAVPRMKQLFVGLNGVDSFALDPHKWLYNALEVGCVLVKHPNDLRGTYGSNPEYYNFHQVYDATHNYYEYGFQNSRGFRAFKLWATIQQIGKQGFVEGISRNIEQAILLFQEADLHPELQAISHNLSITNFRYVPIGTDLQNKEQRTYVNTLNQELLDTLQRNGEVFLSNAILDNRYCLRSCIVNFRTSIKDVIEIVAIVVREGRKTHKRLSLHR
ncbi:MAG: pyridoxal-dependent decarboxylase [Bacteroidota bacterium]